MKDSEVLPSSKGFSAIIYQTKISCEKCGGSGNLKTPENSRRTCLSCYGKGYRYKK